MKRFTIPDHNQLQATATQLESDGDPRAADYRKRYEAAQSAYNSIVDLGKHIGVLTTRIGSHYDQGANVAAFLVESGWIPPEPMGIETAAVDYPEVG
ncbi:hypothetical protein SEA_PHROSTEDPHLAKE_65 [Gordonia phage PhrostedPhlake]|nr:hypothetical protein SEA_PHROSTEDPHLAKE_65 [Gordonia phage PhrostedPhlake]